MSTFERKIAMMGYRAVGKSSLTIQFVEGHFADSYDPTIENTFQRVHKFQNKEYSLHLVDTAGQDEYSLFPRAYSMDIHGYVLVYAINSKKSFETVQVIHDKILDMTGRDAVPLILVGNKTDLHMEREVSKESGIELAKKWKGAFIETSAKERQQVVEIFDKLMFEIEKSSGNIKPEASKCLIS